MRGMGSWLFKEGEKREENNHRARVIVLPLEVAAIVLAGAHARGRNSSRISLTSPTRPVSHGIQLATGGIAVGSRALHGKRREHGQERLPRKYPSR